MIKNTMFSILAAGVVLGLGTGSALAQDKATKRNYEENVKTINSWGKKPEAAKVGLHTVSVETGVPLEQVEAMYKKHPKAGPAGMMIACVLADETKMPPEKFLEARMDGKMWDSMLKDHHVPLEKVNTRLDRLEKSMLNSEKAKKSNKRKDKDN